MSTEEPVKEEENGPVQLEVEESSELGDKVSSIGSAVANDESIGSNDYKVSETNTTNKFADDEKESSFFKSKYFWTIVLLCIAGIFYGITYAFKNVQIKFPLYCSCVWLVCLALICLANYRSDQTASGPSSSSSA